MSVPAPLAARPARVGPGTDAEPDVERRGVRPPDFSAVALDVLREALAPLSGNARRWLERGDRAALDGAGALLDEARDVLRMLGRPATARIAEEVGDLVRSIGEGLPTAPSGIRPEDVARVLVDGGAAVQEAVARLRRPDAADSAIPHVALFNDMRAVRGDALVSDALVLALGIAVSDDPAAPGPAFDPAAVRGTGLARALVDWFRASNAEDEETVRETVGAVVDALDALHARRRDARAAVGAAGRDVVVDDALGAARVVGDALARGALADGGAVRRLFAELERALAGPGPGATLLANLLYYVAIVEDAPPDGTGAAAGATGATGAAGVGGAARAALAERARLVARYDLGRVRAAAREADERRAAGVGSPAPLLGDFRARLADELEPVRDWLTRGQVSVDARRGARLGARLGGTVPALELVGAVRSARTMRELAAGLDSGPNAPGDAEARRLALAETLLELDARLDDELAGPASATAAPPGEATLASRLRSMGARDRARPGPGDGPGRADATAGDAAAAEAKAACIDEARRRVGDAGDAMERALGAPDAPDVTAGADGATLVAGLRTVADALAILPLPEGSALVDGLAGVLADGLERAPSERALERMGDLAAAIHFYLEAVSHPGPASAELLVTGEEAIAALRREARDTGARASGRAEPDRTGAGTDPPAGAPVVARLRLSTKDAHAMTVGALDALERVGIALAAPAPGDAELAALEEEFERLRSIGGATGATELERVAAAAGRFSATARAAADESVSSPSAGEAAHGEGPGEDPGQVVGNDPLAPLREAWAVLPQLIEPLAGGDAGQVPVRGLETLLETLERGARPGHVADRTSELDGTLREVFVEECTGHLDLLERATRDALDGGAPSPGEDVLRALHTLSGSAQTVDAVDIAILVRPLEARALERHRAGAGFEPDELRDVLDTLGELRRRLDAFAGGPDVDGTPDERPGRGGRDDEGDEDRQAPDELPYEDLDARSDGPPDAPPDAPPDGASDDSIDEPSLDRIFEDEAVDLLERLDAVRARAPATAEEHATALGVLHTLKGGARAAGRGALAERAHALEAELRALSPGRAARAVVARVARDLAVELDRSHAGGASSVAAPVRPAAGSGPGAGRDAARGADRNAGKGVARPRARDGHVTRVPEARYERLLGLAADVVAGQARLQADLERLGTAARELEVAAQRWRRLPDASLVLESAAARELVDDVAAVRTLLGEALRTADTDGRRTARAGHALQQELVRARLERLSGMRDRLGRVVEDAAVQARRRARFELVGGETTIDGSLARELLPALEHLVRNAVVHGIEPADAREAAGKDPVGSVRVDVRIDGTELVVGVEDDGRGLDLDAVERRRVALGLPESPELLDTLAAPGLSTLESGDVIGGHGLGIGAARGLVERAGGRLRVGARDAGARFELRVPQRVPVQQVLLVRAGGIDVAVPVNCVREVRALGAGAGPERPPALAALLGEPAPGSSTHVVLLERDGRTRPIGVEGIEGYRELVVQPLGAQLGSLELFTGGSALADGRAVLVLDPARVHDAAGRGGAPVDGSAGDAPSPRARAAATGLDARGRPEALVVDDSPTQRAWLSTLLGRAGFAVSIARDGVEALEFLARRRPQVLLADIDMPRLDGHGLLRALARRRAARRPDADAPRDADADPPVLVVTSRDTAADREAAFENGAAAFLAKPCDETALREALRGCGVLVPDIAVT